MKSRERKPAHVWGDVEVQPGETREVSLAVTQSYSSLTIPIPVIVRRGAEPGPSIFVTAAISGQEAVSAIKLGVNGIVLKASDPEKLLTCIEAVSAGTSWTDPEVMEAALNHSLSPQRSQGKPEQLLTGRTGPYLDWLAATRAELEQRRRRAGP